MAGPEKSLLQTPLVGAFVLLIFCVSGLFLAAVPWALALFLPSAFSIVVLIGLVTLLSPAGNARDYLLVWTLASFALHLIVGAFITHTSLVLYFGPDALLYHEEAFDLVREWRGAGDAVILSEGKEGFYYMLAGLYSLLGPHKIAGVAVNAACAAALIPVLSSLSARLFGYEPVRWVGPLLALTPAFLIWPAQLLREGPVLLFIAVAAASAISLTSRLRVMPVFVLVASLLLLFMFRSSVALLMAGGLLVGIAFGLRRLWIGLSLQTVVLVVMVILMVGLGFGYSGFRLATQVDLGDVEAFRAATARVAGSSISAGDVSSFTGALVTLPIGVTRVLLGPFPWEVDLRQLPAVVDGAFMWALFVTLLVGIREGWHRCGRRLLPLLLPAALLSALLAVVIGNYGLLLRERTQMMVLLVPLFALGLERMIGVKRRGPKSARPAPTQFSLNGIPSADVRTTAPMSGVSVRARSSRALVN